MSDTDHDTHAPASALDSATDHGGDQGGHGHDEHGHGGDALGPIDWKMWGVGVVGVIVALIVVAGFVLATGFSISA